jgi:uncharacterized protein YoxC
MADLDENTLELMERRLADRVVERVRPALFRLYAVAGSAVLTALGLFGWSLISDVKEHARTQATQSVRTTIDPLINESRARFDKHSSEIEKQLSIADWLSQRSRTLAEKVDAQLQQLEPRAKLLEDLGARVTEIEQRRREIEEALKRASLQADSTVELSKQIAELAKQVQRLLEDIQAARQVAGPAGPATPEAPVQNQPPVRNQPAPQTQPPQDPAAPQSPPAVQNQAASQNQAVQSIAQAAQSTYDKVASIQVQPTVWFQFAGGSRAQAEEFSRTLEAKRYILPGEERVGAAAGKREVRFFYPDDAETARRLAADTGEVMRSLGYNPQPQVQVRSLTDYAGKKPKQGVMELWLELPPR